MAERTSSGNVTSEARKKHGSKGGKYPIFDQKSCLAAVKLRNHGHGISAKRVLEKAARWARRNNDQKCLAAVKQARERDKSK